MDNDLATALGTMVTVIVGSGVILGPFVSYGVNIIKQMMRRSALRKVALPLFGLLAGWALTALFAILLGLEMTLQTVALVLVIGFAASMAADHANAKSKEAHRRE